MNRPVVQAALLAAAMVAAGLAGVRWLRVAQREHYLAGSVTRFARRWWSTGPNRVLGVAALVGLMGAALGATPAALVTAAAVAAGPFGLSLRGRTSPLRWTRRLRVLAATVAGISVLAVGLAAMVGLAGAAVAATLVAIASPAIVDAALALTAPIERRLGRRFVDRAATKLRSVHPTVVAITGSYGKTGTKGYVTHLVAGRLSVVPTPKSFNNAVGLARAINEQLIPGTDVFVAEMGTYGPGEIASLCAWVVPDISVITAIGPVHLERMGSEDRVAAAKAEILERAKVAILNIDSPWLAAIAERLEGKVWRCSAVDRRADVCVVDDEGTLRVFVREGGEASHEIARAGGLNAPATNVACAVAVALELGVTPAMIAARLPDLPTAANRREVTAGRSGATIIDDTYNANPAGAAGALHLLQRLAGAADPASGEGRRRIVVTPGMVELGDRQAEENRAFAEAVAKVATDLVVVGQTNGPALVAGARGGQAAVTRVATRDQAVRWVTERVGPGDVVLYENDLPDHFP